MILSIFAGLFAVNLIVMGSGMPEASWFDCYSDEMQKCKFHNFRKTNKFEFTGIKIDLFDVIGNAFASGILFIWLSEIKNIHLNE